MENPGRKVPEAGGVSQQKGVINRPIKEIHSLSLSLLKSAKYRNRVPFKDFLRRQVECRYDFAMSRSNIGSVYDLILQLMTFEEDPELTRDGESYDEEPIAIPTRPSWFVTGVPIIDLSLHMEFLTEDLMTMNYELSLIIETQSEVLQIYEQLIKAALIILKSLQRLRLLVCASCAESTKPVTKVSVSL